CQARTRLPLAVFQAVLRAVVQVLVPATAVAGLWLGPRVFLIDGSSFSMPDVAALQAYFGQPGNQAKGCGFLSVSIRKGTTLGAQWAPAERLRGESMAGVGEGMGRRASERTRDGAGPRPGPLTGSDPSGSWAVEPA